jgi:hypothetical protein
VTLKLWSWARAPWYARFSASRGLRHTGRRRPGVLTFNADRECAKQSSDAAVAADVAVAARAKRGSSRWLCAVAANPLLPLARQSGHGFIRSQLFSRSGD